MKKIFSLCCIFFLLSCSQTKRIDDKPVISSRDQQLHQLIRTYQQFYQQSNPFNDPQEGGNNGKLPDLSAKFLAKQHKKRQKIYKALTRIDNDDLSAANKINSAVLTYVLKNQIDSYNNKEHYMPLTAESGFHVWIANISQQVNLTSEQDYRDYLSKLRALPRYFSQQTAWMNRGIAEGITQPKVVLKGFEKSIQAFIKQDITDSIYYKPFKKMSVHITIEKQKKFQQAAKKIIAEQVMPTYQKYYD